MPVLHRRALITGLLASVAAPALARLTQGATTVYYTPYVGDGVALGSMVPYEEFQRRVITQTVNTVVDNLYQPYGEPSWTMSYWDGENVCQRPIPREEMYL